MHAIGYIRVSTDKQAERGLSLDAQREKLRAMAVVHDSELAEIIVDAESAKNLDRPGMKRILDLVRAGGVDTVIVAKLDRLTRSVRDLADLLDLFQKKGVALVSVAEALDPGSAAGRLVLNIMVSVSQWERETIGERARDAMDLKRSRSEHLGNAPYGFRLAADKKHIEPDRGEQSTLKRLRQLRQDGMSLRAIAVELNRRRLTTRRGSCWRMEYVARLLKAKVAA